MDKFLRCMDIFDSMRRDTTDPAVLALARPLATFASAAQSIESASRFRIIPIGFYHASVGSEWGSRGRKECDQLHHLHCLVSGSARIWHGQEPFDLLPGRCDWLPGNTPVSRECPSGFECYYLTFRCEWLAGIDLLIDWPGRRPTHLGAWDVAEWQSEWERQPMSINTLVRTIATATAQLVNHLPDLTDIVEHHARAQAAFPRVFAYLAERNGSTATVAELAHVHGTSPGTFAQAFARAMGVSPKAFLQRRTNQQACNLLRSSHLSIKAIARQLGFSDPLYFSRWFGRMNGLPPIRFRERQLP